MKTVEPTTLWSIRLTAEQQRQLECVKNYRGVTKAGAFRTWLHWAYWRLPEEAK